MPKILDINNTDVPIDDRLTITLPRDLLFPDGVPDDVAKVESSIKFCEEWKKILESRHPSTEIVPKTMPGVGPGSAMADIGVNIPPKRQRRLMADMTRFEKWLIDRPQKWHVKIGTTEWKRINFQYGDQSEMTQTALGQEF